MKIIVTGGCGFIGYYVVKKLVSLGHNVEIWDNFSVGHRMLEVQFGNPTYCQLDVSFFNIDEMVGRLRSENTENIFIHLAAQSRIQPSIVDTYTNHRSNIDGTYRMLELARRVNTKNFIFAGSSSAYGNAVSLPNKEGMVNDAKSPYALSKIVGELYCKLYSSLYGIPTTILRFFNVYGEGQIEEDSHATVLGIFEKCYREGKPFPIVSPGTQRRDFTHVEDIAFGICLSALGEVFYGETFNLGSGVNYSIFEIVEMFNSDNGITMLEPRSGEYSETLADSSKAQGVLKWCAEHNLIDYINRLKKNNK